MKRLKIKHILGVAYLLMLSACATSLEEGAEDILMVNIRPSEKLCEFLGQISVSEGGMVSGDFMRDSKIKEGANNQLKNRALKMGGNTVFIESRFNDLKHLSSQKLNETLIGYVYLCNF